MTRLRRRSLAIPLESALGAPLALSPPTGSCSTAREQGKVGLVRLRVCPQPLPQVRRTEGANSVRRLGIDTDPPRDPAHPLDAGELGALARTPALALATFWHGPSVARAAALDKDGCR